MSTLPPLKKKTSLVSLAPQPKAADWISPGVVAKPDACRACKYSLIGAGFCGDDSPVGKKMAVLCSAPTKGEILEQVPWWGAQGWVYTKFFLDSAGIPRNEVMISHVLRCRPPFKRVGGVGDNYPTGTDRRNAEFTCRHFDDSHTHRGVIEPGGIKSFSPTRYLVTFAPENALEVTAYKRVIQEDFKKAWRFVQKGHKVCILMGEPAFNLLGGGLCDEGGVKNWRSHYWDAEGWPFDISSKENKPTFAAPTAKQWRKRT